MKVFNNYSKYYDLLYKDKDYDQEAGYVHSLIQKFNHNSKDILELGCGTGLHAMALTKKGYSITGIDQSQEMLKIAHQRTLHTKRKIILKEADARNFLDKNKHDNVISLFHVASYMTSNQDILSFLKTSASNLKRGGLLIFDCWYGPTVLSEKPEVRVKEFEDNKTKIVRIARPTLKATQNVIEVNFEILIINKSKKTIDRLEEVHPMRYFFQPEIEFFLQQSGFELLSAQEWITGKNPGLDTWGVCFIAKLI